MQSSPEVAALMSSASFVGTEQDAIRMLSQNTKTGTTPTSTSSSTTRQDLMDFDNSSLDDVLKLATSQESCSVTHAVCSTYVRGTDSWSNTKLEYPVYYF